MTDAGVGIVPGSDAGVRYSPYDYSVHENPYPTYARLRAEAPLYRNDEFDFWALSRHADVLAAFRDPAHLSNRFGVTLDPAAYGPHAHKSMSFLAMDPPRHTRMRSLVSKAFTTRRVAGLEPEIRALAVDYLDAAMAMGTFDMVGDVAGKLPMDVISQMIGVPASDRAEVRRLADLLVHREEGVFDVPREGMEAALVLAGYFADMVAERRASRRDDLTSGLIDAVVDEGVDAVPHGDRLSDDEIISFLFLMVVAGNETTTKLLANAWFWAWRFPDQKAKALGDPGRAPQWVEETLRYDTSSQMLLRVTTGEVELLGTVIGDGERVLLLIGSANRDGAVFEDPDRYDLDRDTSKLISFGGGRHFCLGAPLARLEARVMLEELVARVADYDIDAERARRVHSINVRGFASLPTSVTAR
ncbi:MAG: cytochrome P450 [Acidimicrobiales bacterium]